MVFQYENSLHIVILFQDPATRKRRKLVVIEDETAEGSDAETPEKENEELCSAAKVIALPKAVAPSSAVPEKNSVKNVVTASSQPPQQSDGPVDEKEVEEG
jgi:hypothetical protein